jgi:hypothetical protein
MPSECTHMPQTACAAAIRNCRRQRARVCPDCFDDFADEFGWMVEES